MGIYCTVFYHQQQVMCFFQLLPFITTLCSNETLSCKKPLLAVGNKTQCSKYPLQLASGFITDLFTKIDRPIKKTEKIYKRLLHPKSITNKFFDFYSYSHIPLLSINKRVGVSIHKLCQETLKLCQKMKRKKIESTL